MSIPAKKAGQYSLDSFKLFKLNEPGNFLDIKLNVYEWELNESMNSGHMWGSATIFDGSGIFYNFLGEGLKGEEEIEITYRDWYEEEDQVLSLFAYSITDVKIDNGANQTLLTYKIHFVSKDKFLTDRKLIRRSFSQDTIDTYVLNVYDDYYLAENEQAPEIFIEETEGTQDLVVPNYSPEQAMHFFARKAYSGFNDSQTFRFFQNKEGYHFKTQEELIWNILDNSEEIQLYITVQNADQTPEGQRILMQNIIDIQFPQHINTMNDMVEGTYYRSTTELDFLNRTETFTEYRYLDDYEQYISPESLPGGAGAHKSKHTKAFVDEHFTYLRDSLVIKDYPEKGSSINGPYLRPHTFYTDIYNKKRSVMNEHYANMVTMRVYGRNEVMAGKIVQIEILKALGSIPEREIDEERSGFYLVESVRNVFNENEFYQVLSMSKSGITGFPEPAEDYDRQPQSPSATTESQ